MKIEFYKYQGAGNDFVMIDDREGRFPYHQLIIERLCNRRFGIGADGLITLKAENKKYYMRYFNADGKESTMCGNGGRCFSRFLRDLGLATQETITFRAVDGEHEAMYKDNEVCLQMSEVSKIYKNPQYTFLNTGSPHHILLVEDTNEIDVKTKGAAIRYSELYPEGTNVNFVQLLSENHIKVRTYERGVEDETLSCGTGATAAAIAVHALGKTKATAIKVSTRGGNLFVKFSVTATGYCDIFLQGPAEKIFRGEINI